MASTGQIRGMLLEEAILFLLRNSGYSVVTSADRDPTLRQGAAGLYVQGRGTEHQIDAIADFRVHQPFCNPQRLLVEGKCYDTDTTGLPVIRNAVGVLKDVSEYWVSKGIHVASKLQVPPKPRYHYQYAIFSATPFTKPAQDYAYSHDIHLLPLTRSAYLRDIISAIRIAADGVLESDDSESLGQIREYVRAKLNTASAGSAQTDDAKLFPSEPLDGFFRACRVVGSCLLAMLGGRLPVLLVPSSDDVVVQLGPRQSVTITWNDEGWYLNDVDGERLFSFDLPDELFTLYARGGQLSQRSAVNMKREVMASIQAIWAPSTQEPPRMIEFVLDRDWIARIEQRLG